MTQECSEPSWLQALTEVTGLCQHGQNTQNSVALSIQEHERVRPGEVLGQIDHVDASTFKCSTHQ